MRTLFHIFFFSALLAGSALKAQTGYIDENRDGINDRFADADGDGICDVTGTVYAHHFDFQDENGDGVNDLWADADGDGVNDYLGRDQKKAAQWIDTDGDGIMDESVSVLRGRALMAHVLDTDGDGCNDITGQRYNGRSVNGCRFGRVAEELDLTDSQFVDCNGDGMNDRITDEVRQMGRGHSPVDVFIDQDGDGIADDRGWGRGKSRGQQRGRK